jgi:hypothetical protein
MNSYWFEEDNDSKRMANKWRKMPLGLPIDKKAGV